VASVTLRNVNTRARESQPARLGARQEQKQRTRRALLDSALELLEQESFSALSLREVARGAGVVPTAFYRHFENMEELGLVLIDDSFRALREMIRAARREPAPEHVIRRSVEILVRHVHQNRPQFRFVARERHSGVPALRQAIRTELRLFSSELATDLARFPYLSSWTTEDLNMMAGLLVNALVSTAEGILDAPIDSPEAEEQVIDTSEKQLRLIALGVPGWKSASD
jgi:AcrR family transcriptional regulator